MTNNISDLVLLVGTNPLPNYVVGKYFLRLNSDLKSLWLVYSEKRREIGQAGTGEFAENIKAVLKSEFPGRELNFEMVALSNVSSASQINEDLQKKMQRAAANSNINIHLNYTGGTKSMAVYVYQYIKNNFKSNSSFSYLDGRRYKLLWDNSQSSSGDLRKEISLPLDSLITLHGYEKKEDKPQSHNYSDYYPALEKFEDLINSDGLVGYLSWKEKNLRANYFTNGKFIKTKQGFLKNLKTNYNYGENQFKPEVAKRRFKEETNEAIYELLLTLPKDKSILDDEGNLWIPDDTIKTNKFLERIKFTIRDFLDGKWLEQYVFTVINRELQKDNILKKDLSQGKISIDSNWEMKKKEGQAKEFELDLIVLNGYQICCISCTTSKNEGPCKLKGFEVIHRARQIGGDEALSVLVTCLDDKNKDKFSTDLEQMTGTTTQNLLVLSQSELKADILWKKIRDYIWGEV